MSYLVLARKYRPQTFAEVVGQEHVTRTLANAFAQDRVHHAFLFCGPRGVGKTTAARILGKALNCETGPTAEPCGTCAACEGIAQGTAVDYFEMDGASNRGIDAIRELRDAVRYQPAALRKKVYVIDEVHMLTTEAFNALLKTLEEPPPHVTFVLATTEPHKLPNTILSRCQRYDFKLVPASRLAAHLESIFTREQLAFDPAALGLIVRESGGSVRDSLSLSDQVISFAGGESLTEAKVAEVLGVADRSLTRSLVEAVAAGEVKTALESVDAATARGVDEVQLARALVRFVRDLAVLRAAPGATGLVEGSADEVAELTALADSIAPARVTQMFERLVRACDELAQTQVPRMVLDLALIDMATLEPLEPLGDLLERLESLEHRLARGSGRPGGGPAGGGDRAPAPRGAPAAAAGGRGPGPGSGPTRASASEGPFQAPASFRPAGAESAAPAPAPQPAVARDHRGAEPPPSPPNGRAASAAPPSGAPFAAPELASPPPAAASEPAPPSPAMELAPAPPTSAPRLDRARLDSDGPAPSGPAPGANGAHSAPRPGSPAPRAQVAASPSPPASAPPEDGMLAEWEAVIAALERLGKLTLVSLYQHARLLSWTDGAIVVGFREDSLEASLASGRDKIDAMRAVLAERYGAPTEFSVETYAADAAADAAHRSLVEVQNERVAADRAAREAAAREHPLTKQVLDAFGATIKEIKIHG